MRPGRRSFRMAVCVGRFLQQLGSAQQIAEFDPCPAVVWSELRDAKQYRLGARTIEAQTPHLRLLT